MELHLDPFGPSEFKALAQANGEHPLVSIYLPTHRVSTQAVIEDPIRLKNGLQSAEEQLAALGIPGSHIHALLKPGYQLQQDDSFWKQQCDGLAVFLRPEEAIRFRLPVEFQELTRVQRNFYLKPLFPLLQQQAPCYVLALAKNSVRLYRATAYTFAEVPAREMPKNLSDALRFDLPEESLQHHTSGPKDGGAGGTIYHGQGTGKDEENDRLLRYFRAIDHGLMSTLKDQHAPLLLAGVEEYQPIYRAVNSYKHLLDRFVSGNPEKVPADVFHRQVWTVLEPILQQEQAAALERYQVASARGQTSEILSDLLAAALAGRVDTVFVCLDVPVWGEVDAATQMVATQTQPGPGTVDFLDRIAVTTFLHGGQVYAIPQAQMPTTAAAAGILRF